MNEHHVHHIPDPLTDKFDLADLPHIAPWVYDEITAAGEGTVKDEVAHMGLDPDEPQAMPTWVLALERCHSPLWSALQQG